jgi:tRNA (guanine-N7-)-methyltransferase
MQTSSNNASVRSVRSYVLRSGRITAAQQRALSELWPRYGIEFHSQRLDLRAVFGRSAPVILEIGFGNGEYLLRRARREPERNFLGVEVHRPGVGHLLLEAAQANIDNLRIIAHDAVEVLEQQIPAGSLEEVLLLFPDPWPKKRHHKRRLVQPPFIALVASRLHVGGRLQIATDWQPYAEQMHADLMACRELRRCPDAASDPASLSRPASAAALPDSSAAIAASATARGQSTAAIEESTRFERRGQRLGHQIHRLLFVRAMHD